MLTLVANSSRPPETVDCRLAEDAACPYSGLSTDLVNSPPVSVLGLGQPVQGTTLGGGMQRIRIPPGDRQSLRPSSPHQGDSHAVRADRQGWFGRALTSFPSPQPAREAAPAALSRWAG